jgi:hypothetical protein
MADLTENIQSYYATYLITLPLRMVVTAVKAVCEYRNRVFGCDSHPNSHLSFLITFLICVLILL